MLTAPAAPYSIATAITYNHQNLPVSLTSGANTATYRYDDAGHRITKQVNGGNTEVYLREGPTTLGVFTVNGAGTPVSSYFNILWEDRVVGRQPSAGNRRYYHFDHLGSTRAVVEGATIVESYDFEPWGLLMPGRTLAGPTKEGFTSKERDAETGLDYFGARYYMPALGRWAAVDPSADAIPEWSTYNYAYDNPVMHTDPDGRQAGMAAMINSGSSEMRAMEWVRNLSPADQLLAMQGKIQPPNGDYQFAHQFDPIARDLKNTYVYLAVSAGVVELEGRAGFGGLDGDIDGIVGFEVGGSAGVGHHYRDAGDDEPVVEVTAQLGPTPFQVSGSNTDAKVGIGGGISLTPGVSVTVSPPKSMLQPEPKSRLGSGGIVQSPDGSRVSRPPPPPTPPVMRACDRTRCP